jgi:branched-chain amino acid aminotransferase
MVRNGAVHTPPATEGALESITIDLLEIFARSLGINFVRRPIDRTELLVADELAVCGTLAEVALVESLDGYRPAGRSGILPALQTRYFEAMRGSNPHEAVEHSFVPVSRPVAPLST